VLVTRAGSIPWQVSWAGPVKVRRFPGYGAPVCGGLKVRGWVGGWLSRVEEKRLGGWVGGVREKS
jgi:hypothetical protein